MTDPAPRLRVRDLHVPRPGGGPDIVRGVDLDLAAGETLALVGASGSGKTTLARAILGLAPSTIRGTVALDGEDVRAARGADRRRLRARMQMVWQDPAASLDPLVPVRHQVAEPLHAGAGRAGIRTSRRDALARADELLEHCGLPRASGDRRPAAFSGGQQQRIAIARALVTDPGLLVCDEPTSALDAAVRGTILDLLERLARERGVSILLVTHDLSVVERLASRTLVMEDGRIVDAGPTVEIMTGGHAPATRTLVDAVPCRHPREADARRRRAMSPAGATTDD